MKQTLKEAARKYADEIYDPADRGILYRETQDDFIAGAEWHAKQSLWINVKERLPEYEGKVLVLYEYEGEMQIQELFYIGEKEWYLVLVKHLRGCQSRLSMKYWKPTEMY